MKSGDMISSLGGSSYWKQETVINEGFPILKNNLQDRGIYDTTQTGSYNFYVSNDTLVPNNYGVNSSEAYNYMKIDLTNVDSSASYKVTVNASIYSEAAHDVGFATIIQTTTPPSTKPAYNSTTGQFMNISGTSTDVTTNKDYSTYITGGKCYYLYLGYRKDGSVNKENERFTVNSITIVCGENIEYASEDTNYIGYYADLDGDGTADGIIYADLAIGSSEEKRWGNNSGAAYGTFSYKKVENGLKKYVLEEQEGSGFGEYTKGMIKEANQTTGKDRFYVMALENVDNTTHTWYNNASGKLDNITNGTGSNDFGSGKTNTNYMMSEERKSVYGELGSNDMWSIIKNKLTEKGKTWFVPSISEWVAFIYECFGSDGRIRFASKRVCELRS